MEAVTHVRPSDRSSGRQQATAGAAILIVLAGLVHLLAAPQHLAHLGHGLFLALAGAAEVSWGVAFWRRPSAALYGLGVALGGTLIVLWAITRVLPAPFGHGGPGEVEAVGILSKVAEGLGLAGLLAMVLLGARSRETQWPTRRMVLALLMLAVLSAFILYGAGLAAERVLPWLGDETDHSVQRGGPPAAASAIISAPSASSASKADPALPSVKELLLLLTRRGNGPPLSTVDAVYAPPILLRSAGEQVPLASQERPTVIFFLLEEHQDHDVDLSPEPIRALLRLDKGEAVEPYEATVLNKDHGRRTSRLLFPLPAGMDPESLNQGRHTLTIFLLLGSSGESAFTWELPLGLPGEVSQPANLETAAPPRALTRTRQGMEYGGKGGIRVDATYATPDYFSTALPPEAAFRYLPDRFTVLLVSETLHTATLPPEPLTASLRLDGQRYQPDLVEQVVSSPHHRVTLMRFPVEPALGVRHRVMELLLPGDERLVWHLPLRADDVRAGSGFQVTWGSVLAVMGGMVAAMWPCLFQLTAFFIPALAGLNMREAGGSVALGRRMGVIKAALFFVLGFTLVYTAAGALIGFAAQRLGASANFEVWQRYAAIVGGVAIILLALRVAAKVRAPLVCKMPVLSRMAHRRSASSPLEMMFAGVAFATGCMTCFGAALVVAMVVYVGLSGSAAFGALTLFLFSLGMGIPLVLAATAMAKVLPMLFRLEKVIPWLGLASSLIMIGFGILLITGNYMALSGWVYRAIPPVIIR